MPPSHIGRSDLRQSEAQAGPGLEFAVDGDAIASGCIFVRTMA